MKIVGILALSIAGAVVTMFCVALASELGFGIERSSDAWIYIKALHLVALLMTGPAAVLVMKEWS